MPAFRMEYGQAMCAWRGALTAVLTVARLPVATQRALHMEHLLFTLYHLKADRDAATREHAQLKAQHAKARPARLRFNKLWGFGPPNWG